MWVWLRHQACLILVMYMIIMYATSSRESNWEVYWLDYLITFTLEPEGGEEQPADQTIWKPPCALEVLQSKTLTCMDSKVPGRKHYILTFKMCSYSHKDQGMPAWAVEESWVTCEICAAEGTRYPFALLVVPVSFCLKWSICCCPN